jgi:hypothetical protein
MEVAKLSPWRNWLKTVEKLMEKLIEEDEKIDRRGPRGWRNW